MVKENTHPPHTRPTQSGERVSPGVDGGAVSRASLRRHVSEIRAVGAS